MSMVDTAPRRNDWQGWLAFVALVAALAWPLFVVAGDQSYLLDWGSQTILAVVIIAIAVVTSLNRQPTAVSILIVLTGGALAVGYAIVALKTVAGIAQDRQMGAVPFLYATAGFWALVVLCWSLAWLSVTRMSAVRPLRPMNRLLLGILVPAIFGATIIFLWEVLVRGLNIPFVILPPPSAIWARLTSSVNFFTANGFVSGVLWDDFRQTFLKAVVAGYVIGCGAGFIAAVAADRIPFLRRGLLPVGNLVSALPIIGVAPIMVMWFGFDWPSKAAVVVAMTFFPMMVNTLAGLEAADQTQRDLMRTYAADYRQSLSMLRLPAAMPFIFNALKINSTLAMIGAIVAEFFGTPIVGMGFRISTEVGRMNTDMVWAEIAVAAIAGSAFYGVVSLIERAATFWHPSFRQP